MSPSARLQDAFYGCAEQGRSLLRLEAACGHSDPRDPRGAGGAHHLRVHDSRRRYQAGICGAGPQRRAVRSRSRPRSVAARDARASVDAHPVPLQPLSATPASRSPTLPNAPPNAPPNYSYFENEDMGSTVSLVPTSAHSGEGISDLLVLLIQLTQTKLVDALMWRDELEGEFLYVPLHITRILLTI